MEILTYILLWFAFAKDHHINGHILLLYHGNLLFQKDYTYEEYLDAVMIF
jgi:hypothetical protein